jgi:hypothetical protein
VELVHLLLNKKNEMEMACGMHGGEEMCIQNFDRKSEGLRPLGGPNLHEMIVIK